MAYKNAMHSRIGQSPYSTYLDSSYALCIYGAVFVYAMYTPFYRTPSSIQGTRYRVYGTPKAILSCTMLIMHAIKAQVCIENILGLKTTYTNKLVLAFNKISQVFGFKLHV